ncbi:hypothetical protein ABE142_26190 [Paenibacillus alvei]|uniref:hypothetical protein n=1 Tax=Paenibacillus alvei TaxID=44250 RepID=UPI003D2C8244
MSKLIPLFATTDKAEAIYSLYLVSDFLEKTKDNGYHWKMVVICLHNSLQGFMVLILRSIDTAKIFVNQEEEHRKPLLKSFLQLYDETISILKEDLQIRNKLNVLSKRNIRELNKLRNKFIHFDSIGYILKMEGKLEIFYTSIEFMKILLYADLNYMNTLSSERGSIKEIINEIEFTLTEFNFLEK